MARYGNVKGWFTIKGVHVPIMEGETKASAAKKYVRQKSNNKSLSDRYGKYKEFEVGLTNRRSTPFALTNEFHDVKEFKEEVNKVLKNSKNEKDLEKVVNKYSSYTKWKLKDVSKAKRVPDKVYNVWLNKTREITLLYEFTGNDVFGNEHILKIKGIN